MAFSPLPFSSLLSNRRAEIVAELAADAEGEPGSHGSAGRPDVGARAAAALELRRLRAKADADREVRDEVCTRRVFVSLVCGTRASLQRYRIRTALVSRFTPSNV